MLNVARSDLLSTILLLSYTSNNTFINVEGRGPCLSCAYHVYDMPRPLVHSVTPDELRFLKNFTLKYIQTRQQWCSKVSELLLLVLHLSMYIILCYVVLTYVRNTLLRAPDYLRNNTHICIIFILSVIVFFNFL